MKTPTGEEETSSEEGDDPMEGGEEKESASSASDLALLRSVMSYRASRKGKTAYVLFDPRCISNGFLYVAGRQGGAGS